MTFKTGALPRPAGVHVPVLTDDMLDRLVAAKKATEAAAKAADTSSPIPWAGDTEVNRQALVTNGFPLYDNDTIGDCTCAAMGHAIAQWTAYSGNTPGGALFTNTAIVGLYSEVTSPPYNPATGANDNGASLFTVCECMMSIGITDTNGVLHKIINYADVSNQVLARFKDCLYVFGSVYLGVAIVAADQANSANGQAWTLPEAGQNVGPFGINHCVVLVDSQINDPDGNNWETVATWGALQKMDSAWASTNIGEALVIFSEDMIGADGDSPIGQTVAQINTELTYVSNTGNG